MKRLLIVVTVVLWVVSQGCANEPVEAKESKKYALVISGGISLGAYEAGYNWAILKYFLAERAKGAPVEFVSFSGTSAGAINALLSAMTWCYASDDGAYNHLTENPFYDTWTQMGLDKLLPIDNDHYGPDDALFSRQPFNAIIEKLKLKLNTPLYRPECKIPIGFTVTREQPKSERVRELDVTLSTQHAVAPFYLRSDANGSRVYFEHYDHDTKIDQLVLPDDEHKHVRFTSKMTKGTIKDVVLASSAFPLAFSKKEIWHCDGETFSTDMRCDNTEALKGEYFVDGGVFDRIPLDLGVALAEHNLSAQPDAEVTYIFMNPDRRRGDHPISYEQEERSVPRDIMSQLKFAGGTISSFRSTQLARTLKAKGFDEQNSTKKLWASSRYSPITGAMLGAFGAFFSESFEEYDYFVGVYDAIENIAEQYKERNVTRIYNQVMPSEPTQRDRFGIDVINMLAADELGRVFEAIPDYAALCDTEQEANCSDYYKLYTVLDATERNNTDPTYHEESSHYFISFLKTLKTMYPEYIFLKRNYDIYYDYILADPDNYHRKPASELIHRFIEIESSQKSFSDPSGLLLKSSTYISGNLYKVKNVPTFCVGSYWPCTRRVYDMTARFQPTSIPEVNWLRALPYEVGFDIVHGGIVPSWQLSLYLNHALYGYLESIDLKPGFYFSTSDWDGNDAPSKQANDINVNFFHLSLYPNVELIDDFLYLGAGGGFIIDMESNDKFKKQDRFAWQHSYYVDFFNVFRLTGMKKVNYYGNDLQIWLGINDLPGLIYWITR